MYILTSSKGELRIPFNNSEGFYIQFNQKGFLTNLTSLSTKSKLTQFTNNDVPSMNFADKRYANYDSTKKININVYSEGLRINISNPNAWGTGNSVYAPNLNDGAAVVNWIGTNGSEANHTAYFGYKKPGTGTIGLANAPDVINWTATNINLNRNSFVNGFLTINSQLSNNTYHHIFHVLAPNLRDNDVITMQLGKERNTNKAAIFTYREPGICELSLNNQLATISFTKDAINLLKPTTISGNLTVNGTITGKKNTTITHYSPVEENIEEYQLGKPVFMSGKRENTK